MCPSPCVVNQPDVYANLSPALPGHVCEVLGRSCFRNKDGLSSAQAHRAPSSRQTVCLDTPKNPPGEQSHRHKPRAPSVSTQRARAHPTPSASTKVLPVQSQPCRALPGGLRARGERREGPQEDRRPAGEGKSCWMSGTPLLEPLAHHRLTMRSVQPTASREGRSGPCQDGLGERPRAA